MSKPSIHVAVLTMAERSGWVNPALAEFLANMRLDSRFVVDRFHYYRGHNRLSPELARNTIARFFLAHSTAENLLMIDNDVAPEYVQRPVNLLELALVMAERGPAVVGAPCPIYRRPKLQLNCFRRAESGWRPLTEEEMAQADENGVLAVDAIGTGAILIHRSILRAVGDPPFRQPRQPDGATIGDGEDVRFCIDAATRGFPILASLNHLCDHLRTTHLLDLAIRQYIRVADEDPDLLESEAGFTPVQPLLSAGLTDPGLDVFELGSQAPGSIDLGPGSHL